MRSVRSGGETCQIRHICVSAYCGPHNEYFDSFRLQIICLDNGLVCGEIVVWNSIRYENGDSVRIRSYGRRFEQLSRHAKPFGRVRLPASDDKGPERRQKSLGRVVGSEVEDEERVVTESDSADARCDRGDIEDSEERVGKTEDISEPVFGVGVDDTRRFVKYQGDVGYSLTV